MFWTDGPGRELPSKLPRSKGHAKYDPKLNPKVWINTYLMAMGIASHNELLATRYLPLMMEGTTSQWINSLSENCIHSWEEMHVPFIKHFEGSYSRATTIEDLERCV